MDDNSTPNWDLDSDEIASVASEDLHDNRPNRWKGPKSTWRQLTIEERLLWRSMRQLADKDLSAHLYDAFALKRQGRDPSTAENLTVTTEDGQQQIWAPPKIWTAWPLREKHVPPEGLFQKQNDEDEKYTFRKEEATMPSTALQDELTATVLRLAKDRYGRRSRRRPVYQSIEGPSSPMRTSMRTRSRARSEDESSLPSSPPVPKLQSDSENMSLDEDEDDSSDGDDETEYEGSEVAHQGKGKTFEPTVSSNDDLSSKLLLPSVRHILSQLDRTLTILHNARVAGLNYLSDSDSSTEEDSEPGTPRRRGRPRSTPQPGKPGDEPSTPKQHNLQGPRPRGRPRKVHTPREGETQEQMQLRVARESHRRLPTTSEDRDAAFEAWLREGDRRIELERSRSRTPAEESKPQEEGAAETNIERKLRRWGLRDWSDVVGAAALAGFPDAVIARTTKRCADLFNQGMIIRRLDEISVSRRPGFTSTEYHPSKIELSPSSSESELEPTLTLSQRRITSRQTSLARSSQPPSPVTPRRGRSLSQDPSRSRSRSSVGLLFCPVPTCDRAATGFSRRGNLRRHMQLVHPGYASDEDDSDDEMVGCVHVDGFLKSIQPGKGWRGEDVLTRKRKRFYGRSVSVEDGDDEGDGNQS